jgi:hypothetical protein
LAEASLTAWSWLIATLRRMFDSWCNGTRYQTEKKVRVESDGGCLDGAILLDMETTI